MGVVDNFVGEYERQFDFWEASARTAHRLLEAELSSSALRAIVTSRAKSVDRLREKLHRRDRVKQYGSLAEISGDIADLAGVRVALYFPGQMDEVERVIRSMFDVRHVRRFPQDDDSADSKTNAAEPEAVGTTQATATVGAHGRRFSGYGARHFRVLIPESSLTAGQERYASALVEIQVASVLMHAWSEVEHDLIYKPLEGKLSPPEYALLDQLNGLVLAGEIALEQLQEAIDARVAAAETPFRDHYELGDFIRTRLSALGVDLTDASLGRVDVLFEYLAKQRIATASSVGRYLADLERDFERRPVAQQLADLMLSGDRSLYLAFLDAMSVSRHTSNRVFTASQNSTAESREKLALGEFVAEWVLFEMLARSLTETQDGRFPAFPAQLRHLAQQELVTSEEFMELSLIRDLRNRVVHGNVHEVPPERLIDAAAWLRDLSATIRQKTRDR